MISDLHPPSFQFVCPPPDGAILVLPNGATRIDLYDRKPMEDYIKQNIARWFSGIGEREGLIIVTGADKCSSWGTACYSGVTRSEVITFTSVGHPCDGSPASYAWQPPYSVRSRSGPGAEAEQNENQCVFIRGYKAKLRPRKLQVPISGMVKSYTDTSIGRPGSASFTSRFAGLFLSANVDAPQDRQYDARDTIEVDDFPVSNDVSLPVATHVVS